MKNRIIWSILSLVLMVGIISFIMVPGVNNKSVSVIFDTDISSDVDDVGAVAVLHSLASVGEVDILAMMVSSGDPWGAPCLDALNTWFQRPDIPIGTITSESVQDESKYTQAIATSIPHKKRSGKDFEESVVLYRQLLSSQPDQSVTIVTVGYLTNLKNLLHSEPDAYSDLGGIQLVAKKVKRLVCMGGQYPQGREWNFYRDTSASQIVVEQWPTEIVFCGFEIGTKILTGKGLRKNSSPTSPIRRSYELYNELTDRPSWDQMTVYYAVKGDSGTADMFTNVSGRNSVGEDGTNVWSSEVGDPALHHYLVLTEKAEVVSDRIEQLMFYQPGSTEN